MLTAKVVGAVNDRALVERVCKSAHLPAAVCERALSHLRMLAVRSRTTPCLGATGEVSKHAVACALAAAQLAVPCERAKLLPLAGVSDAVFQQTFALMQSLLRVKCVLVDKIARTFRLVVGSFHLFARSPSLQDRLERGGNLQLCSNSLAGESGAPCVRGLQSAPTRRARRRCARGGVV